MPGDRTSFIFHRRTTDSYIALRLLASSLALHFGASPKVLSAVPHLLFSTCKAYNV